MLTSIEDLGQVARALRVEMLGKEEAVELAVTTLLAGGHLLIFQDLTEIKKLEPDVVIPMHCSGDNFARAVRQAPLRYLAERLHTVRHGGGHVSFLRGPRPSCARVSVQ